MTTYSCLYSLIYGSKRVSWNLIKYINIPEVMKTGSANLTFCVTFHNFSCLSLGRGSLACLLCFSPLMSVFSFFFSACFLAIDLCRSGKRARKSEKISCNRNGISAPAEKREAIWLPLGSRSDFSGLRQ